MPIEAATNVWTKVEEALAAALPQLPAFQEFCGVETADLTTVFLEEIGRPLVGETYSPEEMARIRRYAIISSSAQGAYRFGRTSMTGYSPSGSLTILFGRLVTPPGSRGVEPVEDETDVALDRWMKNRIGSILEQLADYWDLTGGPFLAGAEVAEGPYYNDPEAWESEGHWRGCDVVIDWGGAQAR